jgi:hypothetical protein
MVLQCTQPKQITRQEVLTSCEMPKSITILVRTEFVPSDLEDSIALPFIIDQEDNILFSETFPIIYQS